MRILPKDSENKRYLKDYEIGEKFTGYYVLRNKELLTRRDGEAYLKLEFGDKSGRLSGMIWEDAEELYHQLDEGGVVKLRGRIEQYRDSRQVAIKLIRKSREEDEFEVSDLIPSVDFDIDKAFAKLRRIANTIKNPSLKELLDSFFDDEEFTEKWITAPAGKLWHHNRLGGLIEHTLSLVRICRFLSKMYPQLDGDLLLTGAILHDIGKVEEYKYEAYIDYSNRGRLVGHIVLGAQWIKERADKIDEFPSDILDRLTHLVLSHQDEFGSPVKPAMREAFVLHYADQIDSKLDALKRIEGELLEGERWKYVRLLERYIDFGENSDLSD